MSEWRGIESAPKDEYVLVCQPGEPLPIIARFGGWEWGWITANGQFLGNEHSNSGPTHWQPLPAAPKPPGDAR